MVIPELEKLAEEERDEFATLFGMRPFQMDEKQKQRWDYFSRKVDVDKYWAQKRQEEASKPTEMLCTIKTRNPCVIQTNYGEFGIPEGLVPPELKEPPGENYHEDSIFADVAVDLEGGTITRFKFKSYLERMTPKELKEFWESMPTTRQK